MARAVQTLRRPPLLPYSSAPPSLPLFLRPRGLHFPPHRDLPAAFSVCAADRWKGSGSPARISTAPVEHASAPEFDFQGEIARLESLRARLAASPTRREKLRVLNSDPWVVRFFSGGRGKTLSYMGLDPFELFLLKCLVAAGQEHVLEAEFGGEEGRSGLKSVMFMLVDFIEKWEGDAGGQEVARHVESGETRAAVKELVRILGEIEKFYNCIGGIIGYQIMVLELLSQSQSEIQSVSWSGLMDDSRNYDFREFHVPTGLDLSRDAEYASQAAFWGIEGMQQLGEIYPLGGSGDRLGLVDSITGECLPAAMLPYCGRTLLEGLIRDLQAREFLHYKLYGKQCITPVAIMTSSAKSNHKRISTLCERFGWFGRGRSSFQLFEQPLVPSIDAEDGHWLIRRPFSPVCKPGGHGALWKLAYDKGVFQWFYKHGRKGAIVRQVSNVVAATDKTILALAGIGLHQRKKLGFASCRREVGATEGINVLVEKRNPDGRWAYGITCIEYTEFEKFGIMASPIHPGSLQAELPANTNILYVDLTSAEKVGSSRNNSCLPGMVLNLKKPVVYMDHFGIQHSVSGGRLECTMQNIADQFLNLYSSRRYGDIEDALDTFIVYNERRKVTSSAKKKRKCGDKSLHQTPDGSFLDIIRNASDLLSYCDIKIPMIGDNNKYVHSGPPFIILLHPALGPLWEISRQKFFGGSISEGSEVQIEVAEFLWRDVEVDGSLIILAENVMGSAKVLGKEPILQYGHRCGKCKLQNVKVLNEGIDWKCSENVYWKHDVRRLEMMKVVLHGNAEFEATDVILQGNHIFEVPDGHRLHVTTGISGLSVELDPLKEEWMDSGSWFWEYKLKRTHVNLELVQL